MKNIIFISTFLICLCMIGCAHTSKPPPLVLEPNKYSYTFGVPSGWDFSFEQAYEFGLRLVFFPRGGNIHVSNSIIYVKEIRGNLSGAIDRVMSNAKDHSPNLRTEISPSIQIPAMPNASAQVRILTGSKDPRQAMEALAFIDHGETIVLVVLTTKNTADWQKDYKAFETVVAGHRYFDCNSPNLAVPCR